MILKLFKRDETFIANLENVICFRAEGHYTHVYYGKDCKTLIPYGLSRIKEEICHITGDENMFIKVGRSHLVNLNKVVYASMVKECVMMMGNDNTVMSISVTKNAIKELMRQLKDAKQKCDGGGEFLSLNRRIIKKGCANRQTMLVGTSFFMFNCEFCHFMPQVRR